MTVAGPRQSARWIADHAPPSPRTAALSVTEPPPPSPFGDPYLPALSGVLSAVGDGVVRVLPSAGSVWAGDDATFINTAFQYANVVRLVDGLTYSVQSPVVVPTGKALASSGVWTSQSVAGIGSDLGATLKPTGSWTAAGQPVSGVVVFLAGQRQSIRGVDIDLSSAPASVDGISLYGNVGGLVVERVAMNKPTGNGLGIYPDLSSHTQDGLNMADVTINQPTGDGVTGKTTDATLTNVHVQGGTGRGFYLAASNTRLIACRADSNAHGFVTDVFYSDGGGFTLIGCGTQSNVGHAVWAYNSSTNGNSPRQPVTVVGGTFYGDGTDGASAALMASGVTTLVVSAPQVLVDNATGPVTGVGTEKLGGNGPPLVQVWGGFINALTACVNDAGPAQLMSYKFHGVQGGSWNGNATPAAPTLFSLNA